MPRRNASSAPSDPRTPSERALDYVIEKLKDDSDLRTMSTRRSLANAITARRRRIEDRDFPDDDPNAHPTDEPDAEASGEFIDRTDPKQVGRPFAVPIRSKSTAEFLAQFGRKIEDE